MKKMYCLVVTNDFSRFTWVFFLATKDETSGILKSFITGIENLVDHKVKVIRCDNETEFKNKEMNQFCEMKGILRQFSVARTPQQNRVAERRNRTLIKAARTMLADSKLPTTFWAEAVNTTCYIHLAKFDDKDDEVFCVGFSLNSKAFKTYYISSGPDWIFDIDALTTTMNYEPIVARTQSNSFAGRKPKRVIQCIEGSKLDRGYARRASTIQKLNAIRLFLAYAAFKDFVVYQIDVKSAFLYGKIEEEVYVCQPPGFEDPDFPDRVYKVEKALDGLHQAPRAWYETLSTYLLDNEFQKGKFDKTLFIKRYKGDILLVQVYMDDIIFGSTKKELCNAFEKLMHKKFQMSSMGELTFFLGLQVQQKKDGIFISQDKYVSEILKKFRFTEVKTASTPIETQKPLLKDENSKEVDVHMYRAVQETDSGCKFHNISLICGYFKLLWTSALDSESTT
ncbi:putative ribonuclease H-like domain-containing protein [Tanacetum coccineum]